jgi:hypothetical protein
LGTYGQDILKGEIPEYYQGIGEAGGQGYLDYAKLMSGDIQKVAAEQDAATGRSLGINQALANQTIGQQSSATAFLDYLNAKEGKKWLFGQGRGITEGVRDTGQNQGFAQNQFNKDVSELDLNRLFGIDQYNVAQDSAFGEGIGDLIGLATSAASIAAAPATGGLSLAGLGLSGSGGNISSLLGMLGGGSGSSKSTTGVPITTSDINYGTIKRPSMYDYSSLM